MTTSPPIRFLAPSVLALALTWAVGPSVAEAKGPAPKLNFTVSVSGYSEDLWWQGYGEFTASGAISDAGEVYAIDGYFDPDGRLIYRCVFIGTLGSFEVDLPDLSGGGTNYPFELSSGTDEYDGLYAAGVTKGSVRKTFSWYTDGMTIKKSKWPYFEFSWAMNGSLSQ